MTWWLFPHPSDDRYQKLVLAHFPLNLRFILGTSFKHRIPSVQWVSGSSFTHRTNVSGYVSELKDGTLQIQAVKTLLGRTHPASVLTSGLPFNVMAFFWICCFVVEKGMTVNNEISLQW